MIGDDRQCRCIAAWGFRVNVENGENGEFSRSGGIGGLD